MTATLAAPSAAPSAAPGEWIVCLGEQRAVVRGRVSCPALDGRGIRVEACADCRMLTWRTDERQRSARCSTESEIDR